MMLNHAAWLEQENGEIRYQHNKAVEEWTEGKADPTVDEFGKPLSELSGRELEVYLSDWGSFG